jgi:hypothetical protein
LAESYEIFYISNFFIRNNANIVAHLELSTVDLMRHDISEPLTALGSGGCYLNWDARSHRSFLFDLIATMKT